MKATIVIVLFLSATVLLAQEPKTANEYMARARKHLAEKNIDKAIADYASAIRLDPKNAPAYAARGQLYWMKRDGDSAVSDWNEAIKIDPKYTVAYLSRGQYWMLNKEYEKAIADYSAALKIDRNDSQTLEKRAFAYLQIKQYDKAIADFDICISKEPLLDFLMTFRGRAHFGNKQYDKAELDFLAALKCGREQNTRNISMTKGVYALFLATCPDGKYRNGKKAVELAKDVVEQSKDKMDRVTLAAAYAENGQFDLAVAEQKKAIDIIRKSNDVELQKKLDRQLALYQDKKPFHEVE